MTRHRPPRPRRANKRPSRSNRHDWLDAALLEKVSGIAAMLDRKREEEEITKASLYQSGRPPAGPP